MRDGKILPFQKGIGLLVRELRIPVIPVTLAGLNNIIDPDTFWPRKEKPPYTLVNHLFSHKKQ